MPRMLGEAVAYGVETHEPHPYPVWECDACGRELGDARPEYADQANEWDYCPWCGTALAAR